MPPPQGLRACTQAAHCVWERAGHPASGRAGLGGRPATRGKSSDRKQHSEAHTWDQGREEGTGRGKGGASGLVTDGCKGRAEGRGCHLRGPTWECVSSPFRVCWRPRLQPPGPPSQSQRSGPGSPGLSSCAYAWEAFLRSCHRLE